MQGNRPVRCEEDRPVVAYIHMDFSHNLLLKYDVMIILTDRRLESELTRSVLRYSCAEISAEGFPSPSDPAWLSCQASGSTDKEGYSACY